MSKSTIEYFYSAHSGYAYLGSARFMEIAKAAGRTIDHRPMHYDAVVAVTGPGVTFRRSRTACYAPPTWAGVWR